MSYTKSLVNKARDCTHNPKIALKYYRKARNNLLTFRSEHPMYLRKTDTLLRRLEAELEKTEHEVKSRRVPR